MKTEFIIQTGVETITTRLSCWPLSLEDLEVPELEINLAGKKRKDDKWLKMGNYKITVTEEWKHGQQCIVPLQ